MTAIWPAGPPKVCSEMANQVLVASDSGMTSRLLAALGGSGSGVMLVSRTPPPRAWGQRREGRASRAGPGLAPRSGLSRR